MGVTTQPEQHLVTSSKASITSMGEDDRRRRIGKPVPRPGGTGGRAATTRPGRDRVQGVNDHAEPATGLGVGDGRDDKARRRDASKHHRTSTIQTAGTQSEGIYRPIRRHSDTDGRERSDTEQQTTTGGSRDTGVRRPTSSTRENDGPTQITTATSNIDAVTRARRPRHDRGGEHARVELGVLQHKAERRRRCRHGTAGDSRSAITAHRTREHRK